jgi:site-specific recombinase XerD
VVVSASDLNPALALAIVIFSRSRGARAKHLSLFSPQVTHTLLPITPVLGSKSEGEMSVSRANPGARKSRSNTALVALPAAGRAVAPPTAELEAAADYARAEKAAATRRAYRTDFAIFRAWCAGRRIEALPATPATVAAFLAWEASRCTRPSTIGRRVAAIRYAHKLEGLPVPTDDERVRATVRGIRRSVGTAPNKKTPATADRIVAMAPIAGGRLADVRDRALLLLGFAGAFRRSELVALDVADIEATTDGLRVTLRRGKSDQEGKGAVIAIVRGATACPVAALHTWLETAKIIAGPVFRPIGKGERLQSTRLTDRSVANIVKARAERAGLDPEQFSGHSLRAGFLTSAAAKGASIFKMMDVSRHRSVDTLRGYVRDAEIFKDHAGAGLL